MFGSVHHVRRTAVVGIVATLPWLGGCPSHEPQQAAFHTKRQAIRIVDENRQAIRRGLKARGTVRGRFRDENGKSISFDLIGKLLVAPPDHLRFTMESILGGDELEVGMNSEKWWIVTQRPRSVYREDQRTHVAAAESGIPITPDQLIESIGLNAFQSATAAQRIVDDHQQLVFFDGDEFGNVIIEKEYWLDRYPPYLIRRIIHRDAEGRVVFESQLDRYKSIRQGGPILPHVIRFSWPEGDSWLTFTVDPWEERDNITPSFRGFVSPYDRGVEFDVVDTPERMGNDHR